MPTTQEKISANAMAGIVATEGENVQRLMSNAQRPNQAGQELIVSVRDVIDSLARGGIGPDQTNIAEIDIIDPAVRRSRNRCRQSR